MAGGAGNVIIGGAIGAVVDVGTGAALDHYPNPLKVGVGANQKICTYNAKQEEEKLAIWNRCAACN